MVRADLGEHQNPIDIAGVRPRQAGDRLIADVDPLVFFGPELLGIDPSP